MDGWKPIPGYNGYEAHPSGLVRTKSRMVPCGKGDTHTRMVRGIIMCGNLVKSTGYIQVMLSERKK
jgi:hypothetical protein